MPRPRKSEDDPKKPSKRWDSTEEVEILMYMMETKLKGFQMEKPTAKIYYERMLLSLKWEDLTVSQVLYKVDKMKKEYYKAVKWAGGTGAGVDSGNVQAHVQSICEHFDLLDVIYGSNEKTIPPNRYESASSSSAGIDVFYNINDDIDDYIEYDPEGEVSNSDGVAMAVDMSSTAACVTNAAPLSSTTSMTRTVVTNPSTSRERNSDRSRSPVVDTVSRMKKALATIPVNRAAGSNHQKPSTAADIMADWQTKRSDVIAEKNRLLSEKVEREDKWKQAELKLCEEKFNFDKEFRLKELELKKMEIEKEERLAKLKLEMDYKLQLEHII